MALIINPSSSIVTCERVGKNIDKCKVRKFIEFPRSGDAELNNMSVCGG